MRRRFAFLSGLSVGIVGAVAVAVWATDKNARQEKATAEIVREAQRAKEETASIDEIPLKVRQALTRLAGGAKVSRYSYEKEDGAEVYRAEWVVDGRECAAAVTCDGILIQHDEQTPAKEIPPAVRQAAARMFPGAKDVIFEKWTTVEYDVRAKVDNEEREAVFSPTGQVVETDEADEPHQGQHKESDKPRK